MFGVSIHLTCPALKSNRIKDSRVKLIFKILHIQCRAYFPLKVERMSQFCALRRGTLSCNWTRMSTVDAQHSNTLCSRLTSWKCIYTVTQMTCQSLEHLNMLDCSDIATINFFLCSLFSSNFVGLGNYLQSILRKKMELFVCILVTWTSGTVF